jgi:hypothetical protein
VQKHFPLLLCRFLARLFSSIASSRICIGWESGTGSDHTYTSLTKSRTSPLLAGEKAQSAKKGQQRNLSLLRSWNGNPLHRYFRLFETRGKLSRLQPNAKIAFSAINCKFYFRRGRRREKNNRKKTFLCPNRKKNFPECHGFVAV